jgi:putative ABC transport system substrate-binding protein
MMAMVERLRELGYSAGKNLSLQYLSAEGRADRLPQLASDCLRANPDMLVAGFGTLTAQAAKAATTTVPIVFTSVGDPVGAGVVASLGRPGGNVTGVTSQASDIVGKRLQIVDELVPGNQVIAVLVNPGTPFGALALQQLKSANERARRHLEVFEVRTQEQLSAGIEAASRAGAGSLITLEDPFLLNLRREIVDMAAKASLPAVYGTREFVDIGGLMSYGVDRRHLSRRAAEYVDRILRGAKPRDLPVEQPTKFELVVNHRAAKALGLVIPPGLLFNADEVIE